MRREGRLTSWIWPAHQHPWCILALFSLVVNDHLLKSHALVPGWLSGKLSDFAGLFYFPLLLGALSHFVLRAWRGECCRLSPWLMALFCGATGVVFSLLQLSVWFSGWYGAWHAWMNGLWPGKAISITPDPSDLIALPMLVLAYWHAQRHSRQGHANLANCGEVCPGGDAELDVVQDHAECVVEARHAP